MNLGYSYIKKQNLGSGKHSRHLHHIVYKHLHSKGSNSITKQIPCITLQKNLIALLKKRQIDSNQSHKDGAVTEIF